MPSFAKLPTLKKNHNQDFTARMPGLFIQNSFRTQDYPLSGQKFGKLLISLPSVVSGRLSFHIPLSQRNAASMIKNEDIWFWQHSNEMRKFGACEVFIKVFSDALLTACFRYTERNNWWTYTKSAGQIMLFFTVKCMDIDVQQVISIFHYSGLGYIKVSIAIFCQLQFIWILMSKTRNRLHLAERPMCTEPN